MTKNRYSTHNPQPENWKLSEKRESSPPYIFPYSGGSDDFRTSRKLLRDLVSAEGIEPSTY
ncbi:MAG: hypothetical protein DMG88_08375 [Acidobacteria bacterium]|nr:MAG: hypothetical protein DMG88_08375 [Acidobacteriota bacterium]